MSILVVAPVDGCLIHYPPPHYVLDNGLWVDKAKPWMGGREPGPHNGHYLTYFHQEDIMHII